jgi:hypothetical protein
VNVSVSGCPIPAQRSPDHEAVVGRAREVRAAADAGDPERFAYQTRRFVVELLAHLQGKGHDLSRLPDGCRQELAQGQHELVEMATALAGADPRCPGVSRSRPARVLVGALQYQRAEEHRALAETAGRGTA